MKKTLLLLVFCLSMAGVWASDCPAKQDEAQVRNLILMIGDGMGLAHVSLLEIESKYAPTAFDRAQSIALMATRSANNRVTDSAAAGTAIACGVKTDNATLGQDPEGRPVESVMARAEAKGMATGLVVTCYLQHATPAAFYAHTANRDNTEAITGDLLKSGIDVLIGGGRKLLAQQDAGGKTYLDDFRSRGYRVASSLAEADTVRSGRLLAAVADKHLAEASERGDYLPRAVSKALEILSADAAGAGFMLMVEGSLIDMAAHANDAAKILDEMRDFERAVAVAMDYADRTPGTLVIVAADHETGGLSAPGDEDDFTLGESGLHYVFGTRSHTAVRVPVYLYGACASEIGGLIDNTELSRRMASLLGLH